VTQGTPTGVSRSRTGANGAEDCSVIVLDKFIQATRDSGYKGTASAISELVDNSIQAGAKRIAITVASSGGDEDKAIEVSVADDGCGMDPATLRQALRFGGSTRFGDRRGLGRYGMGLPNASLSQARRVTVHTWQPTSSATTRAARREKPARVYSTHLDVDEIVRREMVEVPVPALVKAPPSACVGRSGTVVSWSRCDRLDNRRVSTIVRKLESDLGRRFRHFIWEGLRITINGDLLEAFDPLYLHPEALVSGARLFGDEMRFEVRVDGSDARKTGLIRVRFTELPVHAWHKLSNDEKRRIGLSKGAGVSIVRGGREVDYGWFFMGAKHRENYDDWWRCEIQFDPVLDEAFGITHTKQQARPQAHLVEALTPDLEATARALNGRARKAHVAVKASRRFSEAERIANDRDHLLRPLPRGADADAKALMRELEASHPTLKERAEEGDRYAIVEHAVKDTSFFTLARDQDRLVLVLNPDHPFYREIYMPLAEGESPRAPELRAKVELLLLAAARSEAAARGKLPELAKHRLEWSNTLAAFLNDK
jgi:anti-sigma regulatory factor (Ser/Thr protein kinase)